MDKQRIKWRLAFLVLLLSILLWESGYLEIWATNLQRAFSNIVDDIENFLNEWKSLFTLTENLQKEIETLRNENFELYKENLRLKMILENLRQKEETAIWIKELEEKNFSLVYANIIGRDPVKWNLEFKIDKGEKDGIKKGMAVLYKDQIVGKIYKTGKNYSIVKTIYDPNTVIGVMIWETKDHGIVKGAFDHIEMAYIFSDHGIKTNHSVITSGIDEYIPFGLKVGYISQLEEKNVLAFTRIKVYPQVDFSNMEGVAVCLKF
jgi:rod shape-determining protein MreC